MSEPITVVLVDDQQLVRAGLRMIIDAEPDLAVVGEAGDGRAGLVLVSETAPDVTLMDIRMPVMDGIAATRELVESGTSTRVLVLTTFDTDEAVVEAMRAGASGFLLKDTDPDDLARAIRAVAAGDAVVAPSAMRRLLDVLGPGLGSAVGPAGQDAAPDPTAGPDSDLLEPLTDREVDVLALIGRGLTNAEIAVELVVAESTVKTHVSRILMKLGARDRVQAVIVAHRAGLVR